MPRSASPATAAASPPLDVLQALAAASRGPLAWLDADAGVRWCNDAFAATFGAAPAALAGRTLPQLLAPHDAELQQRLARQLADGLPPQGLEVELPPLAGGAPPRPPRHGCLRTLPLPGGGSACLLDLPDERTAALLEAVQTIGGVGLWSRELPGGRGHWDRHVFALWGLDPAGGTPTHDECVALVEPGDWDDDLYLRAVRSPGRYHHRFRIRHRDGSLHHLHSHFEVQADEQGTPVRVLGIVRDESQVYQLASSRAEAQSQLRMALDLGRISVWRYDLRTQLVHRDDAGWRMMGLPPRPEGMPMTDAAALVHPDDVPGLNAALVQAHASGEPIDVEGRHEVGGQWRRMLLRGAVQRDEHGAAVAFVGVMMDITERSDAARQALLLGRRLEAAARAASLGLWSREIATGRLSWDARMPQLFGLAADDVPPDFEHWLQRCVHPDDHARLRDQAQQLGSGREGYEVEYRTVWPDGTLRWLSSRANRDDSDPGQVFGITIDVTERRRTLEALRTAAERSSLAARGVGMGTWEYDIRAGVGHWDAQMFALRGMAVEPRPPSIERRLAVIHPDDRQLFVREMHHARSGGPPSTYEFRVRLPDGSERWLASRATTVFDDAGRPLRRLGVNWDVTDGKRAQIAQQDKAIALRESQAKSRFLARMSHELRTPLNAVLGFAQILLHEGERSAPAVRRERLLHIHGAGEHLLSLINDVLDLSSLDSGEMRLTLEPVALRPLVEATLPLVERLAQQHGVVLGIDALDDCGVLADPTRLRQVLLNLLSNAIKYNRRGGRVLLSAQALQGGGGAWVQLAVTDDGQGMTPEQLRRVFEPFNRLGAERGGVEGTGIGLAIVKALVEHMGGRVEVESEAGVGSRFEVTLQAAATPEPERRGPRTLPMPLEGAAPHPARVLYIEDNAVNVLIVRELLALRPAIDLQVAVDGLSGVEMARRLHPDLVLIDMQLPDIDGHEVLRRLRADPLTAAIACIALSANAMPEDIERALRSGFAAYWTKPLDFKAFISAMDTMFGAPA